MTADRLRQGPPAEAQLGRGTHEALPSSKNQFHNVPQGSLHLPQSLQKVPGWAAGRSGTPSAASLTVQRCGGHPCPAEGCDVPPLQKLWSSREAHNLQAVESSPAEAGAIASSLVKEALASPGSGLDKPTQALMEARFGHDFGAVRIHSGSKANDSAYAVGAQAYTVGDHIVFSDGHYAPGSDAGRLILAHELTHVIQQRQVSVDGTAIGGGLWVSHPSDRFEREADRLAPQVAGPPGDFGPQPRRMVKTAASLDAGSANLQRVPWLVVGGGAGLVAGGAYLLWALHCLSPLQKPMEDETFQRFLPAYHRDMGKPIHNRVWDAFGHCWIGCAGTKKCGRTATAIAGKSREFYREYIGGGPHDSYDQDTNNQTIGRGFGSQGMDCFVACDAAVRKGGLDLSAPEGTCYDDGPEYFAPCEPGGPGPGAPATVAVPPSPSAASATDAGPASTDTDTPGPSDASLTAGAGPASADTPGPSDAGLTAQPTCDCGSPGACTCPDHSDDEVLRIQPFTSAEHVRLGNEAESGQSVLVTQFGSISYGEMIALGDYFSSVSEIELLAASPDGQAQISYALWKVNPARRQPSNPMAKQEVDDRYNRLLAHNETHFSVGSSSGNSNREQYIARHREALRTAWFQGLDPLVVRRSNWQAQEALAAHFLTDAFSAGHIRTPRGAIQQYWESLYPNFREDFVTAIACYMASYINDRDTAGWLVTVDFLTGQIADKIRAQGGEQLTLVSIGNLISIVLHDADSAGLDVVSRQGPGGTGPIRWRAVGDKFLFPSTPDAAATQTAQFAETAIRLGFDEGQQAERAGQAGDPLTPLLDESRFRALDLLPAENPASSSNPSYVWQVSSITALPPNIQALIRAAFDPGPGHGLREGLDAMDQQIKETTPAVDLQVPGFDRHVTGFDLHTGEAWKCFKGILFSDVMRMLALIGSGQTCPPGKNSPCPMP